MPNVSNLVKSIQDIMRKDAGVDGVNIPDGPRAQTRMGAMATAVMVQQQIGIEAVLHYCCRDRNLLGMMSDILGAAALGLRNLLLITGDPPNPPIPAPNPHRMKKTRRPPQPIRQLLKGDFDLLPPILIHAPQRR